MSKDILIDVIKEFDTNKFINFFRQQNRKFIARNKSLSQYSSDKFKKPTLLGEITFPEKYSSMVFCSFQSQEPLSERSGKKSQYDIGKKILADLQKDGGIFIFYDQSGNFRFSLIYPEYLGTRREWSSFRRFTYFVSKDQTNKTFLKQIGEGDFSSLDLIKEAFSVEKVNEEFYKQIATFFYKLTGFTYSKGSKKITNKRLLQLPSISNNHNKTYQEFAVRLIGRIIFCWFLKYKKSTNNKPLISNNILSSNAVNKYKNYYHSVLERLFFEILNSPIDERTKSKLPNEKDIPFLNGGLFEPHNQDYYQFDQVGGSKNIGTLIIPNQWFYDFFEILEQYNFTIDENSVVDAEISVDPEMLGRIFENLLAEINPETGESARKETGSYYTRREIVEFMVNRALTLYLKSKTKLNQNLINQLLSYDDNETDLTQSEKNSIIEALDQIKIIDPACGSGAFPMGLLQKMVLVLQKVDPNSKQWLAKLLENIPDPTAKKAMEYKLKDDPEMWDYIRKMGIIRKSIYGVDIQPIAAEISKLRFFLSLVVDEKIKDKQKNRGIQSLPSLEFKFVCANSLIGLPSGHIKDKNTGQLTLVDDTDKINQLQKFRDEYFYSFGKQKEKIKQEFEQTQQEIFNYQQTQQFKGQLSLTLSSWNPFSNQPSEWFDSNWMFGVKKFDIIIANPPYIGEKGHKELFHEVKNSYLGEFYLGKMDYFYFFFHLALNLARENGAISFITTNYYIAAYGAKKLREDFKDRSIIRNLVNFNELKIFKTATGQHNMLIILTKNKEKDKTIKSENCITHRKGLAKPSDLNQILSWQDKKTKYFSVPQTNLYESGENYIRLSGRLTNKNTSPILNILSRLKHQGAKLITLCNVNVGLYTGADKVTDNYIKNYSLKIDKGEGIFVLTKEELKKLILNSYEKSKIVPFYKNSNIFRWSTNKSPNLYLINISYPGIKNINIKNIPNIFRHISKYKKILINRKSNDNGLQAVIKSGYWYTFTIRQIDFSQPKIVVPQRSKHNTFGYNEIQWHASADVYFITKKDRSIFLKYVLALLNSKLYYLWLYHRGKRKGESLELYRTPLSEIPIKKISEGEQKPFIKLVDKILKITVKENYDPKNPPEEQKKLEAQIDQKVYKLYGLSDDEIKIVEENQK